MNARDFNQQFLALPPKQQSSAIYYFLGAIAFHATDSRGGVTQNDLIDSAATAIEFGKQAYPEEKSA